MSRKKVVVIGGGFSGLSAACFLAKYGFEVELLEKNESLGGRARTFHQDGFNFDMGPSWYWMPDVFDRFFASFGKTASDYYELKRLDPSYRVFFGKDDLIDIPASYTELKNLFESFEAGSGNRLDVFIAEAKKKYDVGMRELVYNPSLSLLEFAKPQVLSNIFRIDLFKSFSSHISKYFSHPKLKSLIEFPVLFLGAMPEETPALYSLMNYADIKLGTWYPMGGMHKIIEAMTALAKELGVTFSTNTSVNKLELDKDNRCHKASTNKGQVDGAVFLSSADYAHTEKAFLNAEHRNYKESYWESKTFAPSSLIYYVGVNKKLKNLQHHNLFFDTEFGKHAREIYKTPSWPSNPLFYVSCPSITDPSVAPEECENIFILIPVAPGLTDTDEIKERYFEMVIQRMEDLTGNEIRNNILFKKAYSGSNFIEDYNSFKGNAYGLANTLMQTAILKPRIKNKKVKNLYYTGQLTVPGPGVPPCLISGEIVAKQILKEQY